MIESTRVRSLSVVLGSSALALLACSGDNNGDSQTSGRIVSKLKSCGLVSESGKFSDWQPESDEDRCELNCILKASCEDFSTEFCGGDEGVSQAYDDCFDACDPFELVECMTEYDGLTKVERCDGDEQCLDGRDEQNCPASAFIDCQGTYEERVSIHRKCDGSADCVNGEDERGCPEANSFVCADGERIPADFECDGEPDCEDESDEAGCQLFACKDGSELLPSAYVCDLERDCNDGSDEDQGCLKLTCSAPSSEDFSSLDAPLMSRQKSRKRG